MKYIHGWSSPRGSAKHLTTVGDDGWPTGGLCGAIIRCSGLEVTKRMKALELCDHCEAARRRLKAKR